MKRLILNWALRQIQEILIDGDSRDIEIFGGLQISILGFLVSVTHNTHFPILLWISFLVGVIQVSAAIFWSLKVRHVTNFILALVCVWVAIAKLTTPDTNTYAVVEYAFMAFVAFYCAFKTKIDMEKVK